MKFGQNISILKTRIGLWKVDDPLGQRKPLDLTFHKISNGILSVSSCANYKPILIKPHLEVEMRSKKINGHHIIRLNLMENPKKITALCLENFYLWPNAVLKKNDP